MPAVSHPDQEFDWSIQTEAALMSSVAATAHQLSGAYIDHTQADAVRQLPPSPPFQINNNNQIFSQITQVGSEFSS